MKKFFSFFAVCATMMLGLSLSSCTPDPCKNVDCGTNGKCDAADGKCLCNAGYELGTDSKCSVESRTKFVGTWRGQNSASGNSHDIVISTSSAAVTKVRISNFANVDCTLNTPIVATADAGATTLGAFAVDGCASCSFTGTAAVATINTTASPATLTMVYSLFVKGGTLAGTDTTLNRTVVYTKQ